MELKIQTVKAGRKTILEDIHLKFKPKTSCAILGRNGSGKSTLVNALTYHPALRTEGEFKDVPMPLFLGFQKPVEIPELTTLQLMMHLDHTYGFKSKTGDEFMHNYSDIIQELMITKDMLSAPLNKNVSGGENKRLELLQMFIIKPKLILLDEIDTGLDLDMLVALGGFLQRYVKQHSPTLIVVTHNLSFLRYFACNRVVILDSGHVIADGGPSLIKELEVKGFAGTFPQLIPR